LVRIVLESGRPSRRPRDWSWISETTLGDPVETLGQSLARLSETLEAAGVSASMARALHALAQWWQRQFGDTESCADAVRVFETRSVESWQEDLRTIAGVNWELVDRILLFVGGCLVYPLDRGTRRIAARHGWRDLSSDYEDWQALFTAAARNSTLDLGELSLWNSAVARDFCKTQPHCEECPLKSLLPARGAVALDGCE
jgi:endonuclease III-like uncharacterized protein